MYRAILEKNGTVFDTERFCTLEEAIRWSEMLRFEDHYLISIYKGKAEEPCVQYIHYRNWKTQEETSSDLFTAF